MTRLDTILKDNLSTLNNWVRVIASARLRSPEQALRIYTTPDNVHFMFIVQILRFLLPDSYEVSMPDSTRGYVPIERGQGYTGFFEVVDTDGCRKGFWFYGDEKGWHLLSALARRQ